MRHKSFPKEGRKKENETIKELRATIKSLEKQVTFLKNEITNIMKPVRDRKPHIDRSKMDYDEWRKDFIKRWRKDVLGDDK